MGRDSSVSIAIRYGLDGPGIESRWSGELPHPSRPALGPTQPPIQWVQGALFLAKVILQYSQFNSYLQTRCCGSISCCVVEQWLEPHNMICCHNTSFANTNRIVNTVI